MTDREKFEGFKRETIARNEEKYGREAREKYGNSAVDASNARVAGMDAGQWAGQEALAKEILSLLKQAYSEGNPAGETAKDMCRKHRQWLNMFWKPGMYSLQVHAQLAEGYVQDDRFRAYYDSAAGEGATEFLRDAIRAYADAGEDTQL